MSLPAGVKVMIEGTTACVRYRDAAGTWFVVGETRYKRRLCRLIAKAERLVRESEEIWETALYCGNKVPYNPMPGDDDIPPE
jgi:hypothetical protein